MSPFDAKGINDFPFQKILDNSNEGILVVVEDRVMYLNNQISLILDIKKDITLPAEVNEIFNDVKYADLLNQIKDFNPTSENSKSFSYLFRKKSYSFQLSAFNIKGCTYKILKSIGLNNENQYSSHQFENVNNIFPSIETDKNGKIIFANQAFLRILNYSDKTILEGIYLTEIMALANKPVLESLFNNIGKFNDAESIEVKLKVSGNNLLPVSLYYYQKNENNIFTGLKCTFIDLTENKRIEKKYRHNQQRLRRILDLVPHMIFLKNAKGDILLANKAGADFYGTSTKELVYENISKFHKNKVELKRILKEDELVIRGNFGHEWEEKLLTGIDGNKELYKVTKVPYQDRGSDEIYSLGIAQNITKQRLAEIETCEINEKYRLLVEKGNDGILIIKENKIVFANQQAARIIEKKAEDIIGYPLTSFVPKNQLQLTLKKYKKSIQSREKNDFYSLKINKPDGSFVYIEVTLNTINYQGKKARIVFVRDITKRRLAEKQSEKDRNLLEQAQKLAHLGSWEWDMLNNKLYCSEEILKILDEDLEINELRSISWIVGFIPTTDRKKVYRGILNSVQTGIKFEADFPAIARNGDRKIIHSQCMVYKDSTGKPASLIGTWLDITDRIRMEQILKEAKIKAEESDKLKSAFLANMSHEIRTPMNAVLGFANLLKREDIDENTRNEYLEHILQSGENLIKLINDIVDISKIESNQLEIEKCPVRLNELMEQIFSRYEELLLLKNKLDIKLQFESAMPDPDFAIITDPYRLQQIFSNLLNNAIKFTSNGIIQFGYCIVNSELLFFVHDQGIGVPEEKKEEIFKRFSKLEDPEKMNKSGTGLGLSISKSLVNLLGGKIWIDKEIEQGSRFCFTLPLEISKPAKSNNLLKDTKEIDFDFNLKGKTILIAEDEILNFKLLESILKKTGAKILWAKNGIEAIQIL